MVTVNFDSLNSYTDLGLFLAEATIEEPAPKRTVVEVPCRDGGLDLSYALTSTLKYKNRQLKLTFKVTDYTNDWVNVFGSIARQLHGKKMKVVFSSDPNWYWDSFVTVEHTNEFNIGTIEVICDAYPYKRKDISLATTATSSGRTVTATVTQQTVVPEVTSDSNVVISGKNLIPYPYLNTSKESNGVVFTVNDDGTVTATGTATGENAQFFLWSRTGDDAGMFLSEGEYVLTGCPAGGGSSTYSVRLNETRNGSAYGVAYDYGNGRTVSVTDETASNQKGVYIQINSGQTVNNLVFKPMLRFSSVSDSNYESYWEYSFDAGTHKDLEFKLAAGTHSLVVKGSGAVTIAYKDGSF